MTTYELCKLIRHNIINRAAEVMNYTNWDNDFAIEYIREITKRFLESDFFIPIQPSELTEVEMKDLGFGKWRENDQMYLIPLWLFPFLADEIKCSSISDKAVLLKSDMDTDNRTGYLAYGVIPKK